jgi:hypothetical protein
MFTLAKQNKIKDICTLIILKHILYQVDKPITRLTSLPKTCKVKENLNKTFNFKALEVSE